MCMGPVGLAATNSTITFLPAPSPPEPYRAPSDSTAARTSPYHLGPKVKLRKPGPAISTFWK